MNDHILKPMSISPMDVTYTYTIVERAPLDRHLLNHIPTSTAKLVVVMKGGTKLDRALTLFNKYPDASRQWMLQQFMERLEMSRAGAATYYTMVKRQLGWDDTRVGWKAQKEDWKQQREEYNAKRAKSKDRRDALLTKAERKKLFV